MSTQITPIRRVVTGNDPQGKSRVLWDSPAPGIHPHKVGGGHTDLWVWYDTPLPLDRENDDGNLPYDFPGPCAGGHLRVVEIQGSRPADYDPKQDLKAQPLHDPIDGPSRRVWERGGKNPYSGATHKSETVDYGIVLSGERELILGDIRLVLKPGDVVVDVGAWHQWMRTPAGGSQTLFNMISARFVDGPVGLMQGDGTVMGGGAVTLPEGVKPNRRVVVIDKEPGRPTLLVDAPTPDVRLDPARPGYASARMWVVDGAPARIVAETLHLPHRIEPPKGGSICTMLTVPPDAGWKGKVGEAEVRAFFAAMGSPSASTYSASASHPYMQKTRTLDFCAVIEGEVTLVLDTQEVTLGAGDIVVQKAANHAWSNRSGKPAVIAVMSHDAE